jgi:hypothetical protein
MSQEGPSGIESTIEKGKNVKMILRFIRHGERTKEGILTDYGREVTKQKARESGIQKEEYDAVKALGSNAGPRREIEPGKNGGLKKIGRSLETAEIYAQEIAGEDTSQTRPRNLLNYEPLVSKPPYDHTAIYNGALPENFDLLPDDEKARASKHAQAAVLDHLIGLNTPEAQAYKREVAGAFSSFIIRSENLAERLKAGSKVLMPSGTHGGLIEPFLAETLVRRMEDGREIRGFERIEEIGGDFDPSESFDVEISTEENGNLGPLRLKWEKDSPRPSAPEMYLDSDKVRELAAYYKELHSVKDNEVIYTANLEDIQFKGVLNYPWGEKEKRNVLIVEGFDFGLFGDKVICDPDRFPEKAHEIAEMKKELARGNQQPYWDFIAGTFFERLDKDVK